LPKFDKALCDRFTAIRGGYSVVTRTEATHDRAVTLSISDNEKPLVLARFAPKIHRGSTESLAALKPFIRLDETGHEEEVELKLTYPKQEGEELRLYFTQGLLDPAIGDVFFIFERQSGPLVVGSMPTGKWSVLESEDIADADYQNEIESRQLGVPARKVTGEYTTFERNAALAISALERAHYACEVDTSHGSFESAASGRPYMEAHHIIPISKSGEFLSTLDVLHNIVSLCATCHRRVHYGTAPDRRSMIAQLTTERPQLLAHFAVDLATVLRANGLS
jgi:5-methylcytosine-specific restriction protein A